MADLGRFYREMQGELDAGEFTPDHEPPQELAEEITRLRKDVEVLTADRDTAYDQGFSDGLRMGDARATDVESRLAALEKLTSDQADALEAQSQLIDTLRTDMRGAQAAIRGLGQRGDEIQMNVSALGGDHDDLKAAFKALRKSRPYNAWTDG
ncbi:hypothetical protein [Nocardiopsis sp. NPDC058789]|uniref:hypothetical protein n=1 Tax=Nocardiopsis sp. NPDC058789 TaxID=3346634 RepID=UPI00366E8938